MAIQRINGSRGHWYKIDGRKADGVTTLIGDGLPKKALVYWSAKSVAEYVASNREHLRECFDWMDDDQLVAMLKQVPWSQRDKAAVRGTDVHELAEKLLHGEEVEIPEHLAGYVESCVRFLDDWQVEPILSETVVASRRWNWCGTLDGVGRVRDGRVPLFDWKTTASGIWPETAFQLSAYANAEVYLDADGNEQDFTQLPVTDGWGVWLREDGYDVLPVDISEKTYKAFLHIAYVARTTKTMKALVGDPLPLPGTETTAEDVA